jgi:hypothetical protein
LVDDFLRWLGPVGPPEPCAFADGFGVEELHDAARGEIPERVFNSDGFGEIIKPDTPCSLREEDEVGRLRCNFPGCSLSTRERISAFHAGVKYSSANRVIA